MTEIIFLIKELSPEQMLKVIIFGVFIFAFSYITIKTGILQNITKGITSIFLFTDNDRVQSNSLYKKLSDLEVSVSTIQQTLSDKTFQEKKELIDKEINTYIETNLPNIIQESINKLKGIDPSIESDIRKIINEETISYLDKHDVDEIVTEHNTIAYEKLKLDTFNNLEKTVSYEPHSVGRTKIIMINLFVIFNFGVLIFYIFAGSILSDKALLSIVSLYISLAAFIVYIYRTSNSRSCALLALREDAKKLFDVQDYLQKFKLGNSVTSIDVEVLRLIMANHSEREKAIEHPCELILKGVTNSNIQFKGGKMAIKGAKEE